MWSTGDITATTALLEAALDTATTPSARVALRGLEVWLAGATGQPVPSHSEDHIDSTDDGTALVWQESGRKINATGWLARLHAWSASRQPAAGP